MCCRTSRLVGGYTLIELFVTIAVLIIVLGLMVDLSNRVRRNSSDELTRQLLRQLTALMDDYLARDGGQLPPVSPFIASDGSGGAAGGAGVVVAAVRIPTEAELQVSAVRNNADFVRVLRGGLGVAPPPVGSDAAHPATGGAAVGLFAGLPLSLYDELTVHDPWGSPIVFMPHQNPLIGLAPGDRFFFFSAGPDRQYLTRRDNLYSYEDIAAQPTPQGGAK